ncbi:MAG: L-2-hydroxyglutarate oxidase [Chloroflexi bacterium]|nr:L-2-hydroxyglutarate oxidase [Chloroflexota bacterium]
MSNLTDSTMDLTIVGAGIIGLATAYAVSQRFPHLKVTILEKEPDVAQHQTGNNSGVLHAGIYYKPGTLRAKLCVQGVRQMTDFCDTHGIEYQRCGKLIVAVTEDELPRLKTLLERGIANGVQGLRQMNQAELHEIEPFAAGIAAIHSPNTGIVNYKAVSRKLRDLLHERGIEVQLTQKVISISHRQNLLNVITSNFELQNKHLINCGGLYADSIGNMMGVTSEIRIIPFRGEYFLIRKEKHNMVRGLIYPVPDPSFPFLGVHFTRVIRDDGIGVEAGPNAVFAFAREGYRFSKINLSETADALGFVGFRRLAAKYWRTGLNEMRRSLSKPLFVKSLQRMMPSIQANDLVPGGAGVRAMAIHRSGEMVDDFYIVDSPKALHVLNAPSPAATASFAIGEYIAQQAANLFNW